MATYNLGRVTPNFIGEWNNIREYKILDVVSYNGSSYICGSTNKNVVPTTQGYYWTLLAQGYGTNLNDGSVTEDIIADGAVSEAKLSTSLQQTLDNLERNFNGAYDAIQDIEDTLNPIPSQVTQLETNQGGLIREILLMNNRLTPLEEKCTQILYLGNDLNSAADAYNMCAVFDVVTNSNVKIICFDTKYGKGGTIYQQIADNYTTQYLFFEGKTRASYMRTFNATTGEAIHSWKEISFFTDFEFNSSDYKIYGYTAGKDNVGTTTKKREIINLSSIKSAINNVNTTIADGSITQSKLAFNSVGINQIENGSVNWLKVADNTIGTNHLVNDSVNTDKIQNNSVTYEKLVPYDFTTPKVIGVSEFNVNNATEGQKYEINSQTFSVSITEPLNAPYEYNVTDLLGLTDNDMLLSYRGSFKCYDSNNNIIDYGFYPTGRNTIFYADNKILYFSPVLSDISNDTKQMDIIIIFEYVKYGN